MARLVIDRTETSLHTFPGDGSTSNVSVWAPAGHTIIGGGVVSPDADMHGYVSLPAQQDASVQSATFRGWVDGPSSKQGRGYILHAELA